ncbi:MAG: type IV pilus twitching motility protein PilT [Candidatus Zixiibacteriota bacterium]
MTLKQLLTEMLKYNASDLHIRVNVRPHLRIDGNLQQIPCDPVSADQMDSYVNQILNDTQKERFAKKMELDLALSVVKLGRFRINLYRQRGTVGIAIRSVNDIIPSMEELNLPDVVKKIADSRRGLVVVTGVTGSGKSTTLASMIEYMNETRSENVVTIEDPIEYVYRDKNCIISQREVGGDTESFPAALRHAFRQDPDVILIGEIRDIETMSIALTAADTGHLVLTTLHTLNAIETVSRMINFFPPHQHQQIRLLLSGTLEAIICQRLLRRCDEPGRIPACEILVSTGAIRECLLAEGKTHDIIGLVEDGATQYGMQSFDQALMQHYRANIIDFEEALQNATNSDDFDLRVKGITGASDRWADEHEGSQQSDVTPDSMPGMKKY